MSDSKKPYILQISEAAATPDEVWLIGPFSDVSVASIWGEANAEAEDNWQIVCLSDAEVSRPLRVFQPDAALP